MDKLQTLDKIDDLIENHCRDCQAIKAIREEHGYKNGETYCLKICKVGRSLKKLGKQLAGTAGQIVGKELNKENYIELAKHYKDVEIAKIYKVSAATLTRRKKKWGIQRPRFNKTAQDYEKLKEMGYKEKEIQEAWSIGQAELIERKRRWGL